MVYRKRKTMKRKTTRSTSTRKSAGTKLPICIRNPFSTKMLNPKINDGLTPYSCGLRLQAARRITHFGAEAPMVIHLYPGLDAGVQVFRSQDGIVKNDGVYNDHVKFTALGKAYTATQNSGQAVVAWRTVSQAARFTLVNNCEANDGYFEAIRINTQRDSTDWTFFPNGGIANSVNVMSAGAVSVVEGQTAPNATTAAAKPPDGKEVVNLPGHTVSATDTSYCTHNTFVTGKLKDIHKYIFQLRPVNHTLEFRTLSQNTGGCSAHECIDTNFDSIVLKIYGRSYPSGTAAADAILTNLHMHIIANQEVVYDEQSNLHRYMTNTKFDNAEIEAIKKANTQNVKAGYISKMK